MAAAIQCMACLVYKNKMRCYDGSYARFSPFLQVHASVRVVVLQLLIVQRMT